MGHGHEEEHGKKDEFDHGDVEPKEYWEATPSRRARPQFDPAEIARQYLDDMERGDRLHNKRKRR